MRITSVNSAVAGGGAQRVATSLHTEYLSRGHDSWLLVGARNADAPQTLAIPNDLYRGPAARPIRRAAAMAARASSRDRDFGWYVDRTLRAIAEPARYARVARGHEDFDHPGTAHVLELTPQPPEVLHLHNLHGSYFDLRMLPSITHRVTSMITLHDTWLLTGHCAHPLNCDGMDHACETCPHLDRYVPLMHDASAENFALKRRLLAASRLAYIAPSKWMLDLAIDSGALAHALDAKVIHNGIDTRVFAPGNRAAARSELGLPNDVPVLLCVGQDLESNPYKGFDVLEAACRLLAAQHTPIVLLAVGGNGVDRAHGSVELRFMPSLDDASLVKHYQAANIYVHPARAEVLGLTIIEAMACGLPVVASRIGGIPEVVTDGSTGILVTPDDPEQLARSIALLIQDTTLAEEMGAEGTKRSSAYFDLRAQSDAHLAYYAALMSMGARA